MFQIPDFVHEFGDSDNHTYRGSLMRHLAVERLLMWIRSLSLNCDGVPGYRFLDAFLDLLFGLNCNFFLYGISRST